jgi:hypothetical protein
MKIMTRSRDSGVHSLSVLCDCGHTFTWTSDADLVACPICRKKERWRHGRWSESNSWAQAHPLMPHAHKPVEGEP